MAVCLPLLAGADGTPAVAAAALGATLAGTNALAAYGLVLWSRSRSNRDFMRAILGGMLVRMGASLVAVVVAIRWLAVPQLPLVLSLLGHFVIFLALEMFAVQKSSGKLQASR
jgi:hypothetical protein